jgi:ribose-phosphate pyrophosphokinase
MKIIAGSGAAGLGKKISELMGLEKIKAEINRFPDGECYVRIDEDLGGEGVVTIQSTYPDQNIIELIFLQEALKNAGAAKRKVVIPYFAYARQDKLFKQGEIVSAEVTAKMLDPHMDEVLIVNPHKQQILDYFKKSSRSISAAPAIAEYLRKKGVELVIGPDKHAGEIAKEVAEKLNIKWDWLDKKRVSSNEVILEKRDIDCSGKNVALVDDIISTGGTLAKAVSAIKDQGASKVTACCIHGLFAGESEKKLKNAGCSDLVSTDSIPTKYSKISIAKIIADALGGTE